jgi:hypothetical protein
MVRAFLLPAGRREADVGDEHKEETEQPEEQHSEEQQEQHQEEQPQEGLEEVLREKDAKIAKLEAKVAEAAKADETAKGLREEIEKLRATVADERVEFALRSLGCKSVKAAKALLDEHEGDPAKLKEAEPWLFSARHLGSTGLKPEGAATDDDKTLKRWRAIAGLDDDKDKE